MCSVVFRKFFQKVGTRKAYILHGKWRAWNEFVEHLRRLQSAIFVSCVFLSQMISFFGFFSHGHETEIVEVFMIESVATARSATSTN